MNNQEDSAKTILEEVVQELERMLLKDMKVFVGKLFYPKVEGFAPQPIFYPKTVKEVYVNQENTVYIRCENGYLYHFDTVVFLKKIA